MSRRVVIADEPALPRVEEVVLSEADREAELRRHDGVNSEPAPGGDEAPVAPQGEFVAAGPADPVSTPNPVAPPGPPPRTAPPSGANMPPPLLAALGALGVLVWALIRRRRRPEPSPAEKLAHATQAVSASSLALGGRAATKVADAAGPVTERTGELARRGAHVGAEAAQRVATVAAPAALAAAGVAAREGRRAGARAAEGVSELVSHAGEVGSKAAHTGQKLTSTLAEVPETVVEGAESLHQKWRKLTFRLTVLVFGGLGYVLGARAGRQRYDQIVRAASNLAQRPEVKTAQERIRKTADTGRSSDYDDVTSTGGPLSGPPDHTD